MILILHFSQFVKLSDFLVGIICPTADVVCVDTESQWSLVFLSDGFS